MTIGSLACGRIGFDATAEEADASIGWWDQGWQSRVSLRLDNQGVTEELLNFPVLVHLYSEVFNYAQAQADGSDLRFVLDDDMTELAHEIEAFVPGGDSYIWVNVPRILANSDQTTIWMYFSNQTPGASRPASEVWQDFHAVYHLSDPANESTDRYPGNPGAGNQPQVPVTAIGQIAGGQEFDGIDDVVTVTPSDSFNFTQSRITIEAWVELSNLRADWNNFVGISGYTKGYRMGIHGVNGRSGFQCPGETHTVNSANKPVPPGWHYFVGTWDGQFMRHYVDAALDVVPLARTGAIVESDQPLKIGNAGYPFRGIVDEVRISNVYRSEQWIVASFRSMTDTMVTFE